MDLIERFRYIMKINQLSASAFAHEIGVQASSVSHVLSGRNKPSLEFIQKILNRYPKVDAAWLIQGKTSVAPKQESEHLNKDSEPLVKETARSAMSVRENQDRKKIERILIFYNDQTFEEFKSTP